MVNTLEVITVAEITFFMHAFGDFELQGTQLFSGKCKQGSSV